MADLEDRMRGIEKTTGGGGGGGHDGERPVLVHAAPDWSWERALAYHQRTKGPISADANVIYIRHSFLSPLSFWPVDEIAAEEVSPAPLTSSTSRG